jgi:hypothetical protein
MSRFAVRGRERDPQKTAEAARDRRYAKIGELAPAAAVEFPRRPPLAVSTRIDS